jgi:hypothetical protein
LSETVVGRRVLFVTFSCGKKKSMWICGKEKLVRISGEIKVNPNFGHNLKKALDKAKNAHIWTGSDSSTAFGMT